LTQREPRPNRVAFLITSSSGGGAEQQVRALALAFRRRGWDVGVISMLPLEPFLMDLHGEGIRVATLDMDKGIPDPRAVARLARLIRRWRPDVLHAHMVHANLLARLSRLLVRTPVLISTIHNQDEGAQWRYVAYRLTDRLTDATTTVSLVAVDESVRRGAVRRDRIRLIPNGIVIGDHHPDAVVRDRVRAELGLSDRFIWLAVGRLTDAKAYPDMVDAFGRVFAADARAHLLIAGEGPLQQAIQAAIDAAGLAAEIRLLGRRSDVPALMQAADGFVMSSAWEGLPMVLLEASASALPIVATDVGGSRDAIVEGRSGHITPPGDPAALADAMLAVMAMPADAQLAMGEAAREHVVAFEMESVVDAWQDLYQRLLADVRR
jgi:glycosyltransferase involved in cell wall biosynthesis